MKDWQAHWDDFINEAEETKLKSSGNVGSHFDRTIANLTPSQRTEIATELDKLFSDQEFSKLFDDYQKDPDSLEDFDKNFLGDTAEEFISQQGLEKEIDLPGDDAGISFISALREKISSLGESDAIPNFPIHVDGRGAEMDTDEWAAAHILGVAEE